MLAALQAPIIMMSQNRQAAKDRLAAALDYEVNVKAESAIMELHDKIDRLAQLAAVAGEAVADARIELPTAELTVASEARALA
jgi:uncharacterized membrane protein